MLGPTSFLCIEGRLGFMSGLQSERSFQDHI